MKETLTTERLLGKIEAAVEAISLQVPALAKKLEEFQLDQTRLNSSEIEKYGYVLTRLGAIEDTLKDIVKAMGKYSENQSETEKQVDGIFDRVVVLEGSLKQKSKKKTENKKVFKTSCINILLYAIKVVLAGALAALGLGVFG